MERAATVDGVGPVGVTAVHRCLVHGVTLVIVHGGVRPVDGDLMEVRPAQPAHLSVDVAEQAGGQQRVVGNVDAGHQVAGAEGHLLGLGEEVHRVPVQLHQSDGLDGAQLLGHELGGVQQVDALEHLLGAIGHDLDPQLPLRIVPGFDVVGEVTPVEVGVAAVGDQALLPDHGVHTLLGLPVELDEAGGPVGSLQPEGVHTEALHGAEAEGDGPVRHGPGHHMGGLGVQADEVPEGVVRRLGLGNLAGLLGLHRVDQVGELDAVLNEEHRNVVAHQVPRAL